MRQRIVTGVLPESEVVPSQNQLVAEFGVSRGSVARAMLLLQAEGYVFSQKGKGIYVRPEKERALLQQPPGPPAGA